MTTPAQTDNTPPTTGDDEVTPPAPRRNGSNGRRPNRPLVAPTRTAPRRPRTDAATRAAAETAVDETTADPPPPDSEGIATRVARASRTPRRPRAATKPPVQEAEPEIEDATSAADPQPVDDDPEATADVETTSRATPRRSFLVGVAAVVLAALVAALAYSVWHMRTVDAQNGRLSAQSHLGASALTAATTYGGYLSSYDYKTLHSGNSAWAQVENNATASFKKDFTSTSGSLGNLLTQYNATATGKVVAAGVQSVSSTRAVVLLFIDQTVTNTVQKPNSVTQPLRVQLTMVRQNGKWLIDNLQVPN